MTRPVRSLRASSPISRSSASDIDSTLRMVPMPLQRGQRMCVVSLERRPQALARQLQQPEARQPADLDAGAVHLDRIAQQVLDLALVGGRLHVDEIDHDQAADVAQCAAGARSPRPPRDWYCAPWPRCRRRAVARAELMSMETSASVWSMTRLPPEGRVHLVRVRRLDLALDLVAREQRHRIV